MGGFTTVCTLIYVNENAGVWGMIKKMNMCFYRKSIDYMSVCMIWSMAQSDAYKHGALSVILQSGQQRLLGVTLCHSDPTQTHRTLPDLLSLDINRCLLFWGVSEQQLWRGIDYYTVYTPSLVLPRLSELPSMLALLSVLHTLYKSWSRCHRIDWVVPHTLTSHSCYP